MLLGKSPCHIRSLQFQSFYGSCLVKSLCVSLKMQGINESSYLQLVLLSSPLFNVIHQAEDRLHKRRELSAGMNVVFWQAYKCFFTSLSPCISEILHLILAKILRPTIWCLEYEALTQLNFPELSFTQHPPVALKGIIGIIGNVLLSLPQAMDISGQHWLFSFQALET